MRTLFGFGTPREMAAAIAAAWNIVLRFLLASADGLRRRLVGTSILPTVNAPVAACGGLAVATGP